MPTKTSKNKDFKFTKKKFNVIYKLTKIDK